ncbi:Replication protein A 70 kDa DNA-binding subunit [Bienertia sinuspersici]
MKPEPKKLKDLDDKAGNYKVKVKVIHKASPQQSPNKKRFQRLILKDEEGYTMKATLFEKDIERYEEALKRNGEYEISNATIAQTPAQHVSHPSEYQMTINSRARISPLITDFTLLEPQYRSISAIPEPYVLGVLFYVDDIKIINQANVREIHITDPSTITFVGFSMASTMSSEIIKHPQGTKAESLRTWYFTIRFTQNMLLLTYRAIQNPALLNDRRSKLLEIHTPSTYNNITSVKEINARQSSTTWQDERFWVNVTMPMATAKNMYVYLGCNKCGRRNNEIENAVYKCSKCFAIDATSVPR